MIKTQIQIRPAQSEDLDQIVTLIRETATWLKSKDIHQWSNSYPVSRLEKEFLKSELFVVLNEAQSIVGTVSLSKDKGEVWPEDESPALYLHRLAIFRKYSGQKLGAQIMDWAVEFCKEKQYKHLRLNCDKTNPFLSGYYRQYGFICIGEFYYSPWKMTFNLFEFNIEGKV